MKGCYEQYRKLTDNLLSIFALYQRVVWDSEIVSDCDSKSSVKVPAMLTKGDDLREELCVIPTPVSTLLPPWDLKKLDYTITPLQLLEKKLKTKLPYTITPLNFSPKKN